MSYWPNIDERFQVPRARPKRAVAEGIKLSRNSDMLLKMAIEFGCNEKKLLFVRYLYATGKIRD